MVFALHGGHLHQRHERYLTNFPLYGFDLAFAHKAERSNITFSYLYVHLGRKDRNSINHYFTLYLILMRIT
jgi:hypothetical protein